MCIVCVSVCADGGLQNVLCVCRGRATLSVYCVCVCVCRRTAIECVVCVQTEGYRVFCMCADGGLQSVLYVCRRRATECIVCADGGLQCVCVCGGGGDMCADEGLH